MDSQTAPLKRPNAFLKMLIWWKVDSAELEQQVARYEDYSLFKSARKLSALCLLASAGLTVALILVHLVPKSAYVDVAAFLLLAPFAYRGNRWALIAAMIFWSFEKVSGLRHFGGNAVVQLIWWAAYLKVFYLAFKVEVEMRKEPQPFIEKIAV